MQQRSIFPRLLASSLGMLSLPGRPPLVYTRNHTTAKRPTPICLTSQSIHSGDFLAVNVVTHSLTSKEIQSQEKKE